MIELVWDSRRFGTITAPSGLSVTVGEDAHFSPDDLLAMSVASCLMRTFLRLADEARLPILSYASTARAEPACEAEVEPHVTVHAYIVAPSGVGEAALRNLAARAAGRSPIARLLGDRAVITADVRVLCRA